VRLFQAENMRGGWFVGDFSPTVFRTSAAEVAVKRYAAGDREPSHHHKRADEVTLVVTGRVVMQGTTLGPGAIVHLARGESADFLALEPSVTVVVKVPSVPDDKYLD
jgi:hypothetical protein